MKILPWALAIHVGAGKKMFDCFLVSATRGAYIVGQGTGYMVSVLQGKPFVNEFADYAFL